MTTRTMDRRVRALETDDRQAAKWTTYAHHEGDPAAAADITALKAQGFNVFVTCYEGPPDDVGQAQETAQ